jgi:hypothetical protein
MSASSLDIADIHKEYDRLIAADAESNLQGDYSSSYSA